MIKNTGWGSSTMKLWSNISGVMVMQKDYMHHLIGGIEIVLMMNLMVVEIVSTLLESQRTFFLEILNVTIILQVMYVSVRCDFYILCILHINISKVILLLKNLLFIYVQCSPLNSGSVISEILIIQTGDFGTC